MSDQFDLEFSSDEQVERELDLITKKIIEYDSRPSVITPLKYEEMKFAYAVLKYLTKDMKDAVLTYELNKPFQSMGYISLDARSMEFSNPEQFSRVAEFASNMEVYPLTKNMVRLTFTFHGLTKPIE